MNYEGYKLERKGDNVRDLLNKIEALEDATPLKGGTMSSTDKDKLDNIGTLSQRDIDDICTDY